MPRNLDDSLYSGGPYGHEGPPVAETLWGYCLIKEMARARSEGRLKVEFSVVDEMALELSKRITNWELPERDN